MQVYFLHRFTAGTLCGGRIGHRCIYVAQNSRVESTVKSGGSGLRDGSDPVVADWLVSIDLKDIFSDVIEPANTAWTYNDGVSLTGKDLKLVDLKRIAVDTVHLDDCHIVAIDGESVIRVACNIDQTEAIAVQINFLVSASTSMISMQISRTACQPRQ